jgi:hypothetical protein
MLNASRIPDNTMVASKWSQPPHIGRNKRPPTTMMVNYTPTDFPALQKKSRKEFTGKNPDTANRMTASLRGKRTPSNLDNTSTHFNASATLAGTPFTKEDGQSLFTSLTESFVEEMKCQAAQQHQTISNLISSQLHRNEAYIREQVAMRKEEAEVREEDTEARREQAAQFTQLLSLVANNRVSQPPVTTDTGPEAAQATLQHTTMDATPAWDSPKRSMDMDSDSNQHNNSPGRSII